MEQKINWKLAQLSANFAPSSVSETKQAFGFELVLFFISLGIRGLPITPLRQMVKPSFYKSLLISPVEAWVTLRGHITDSRFAGVRVVHSELGGKYDALALEW
jgi:hypothetical protein